jgi:hypothetical protein
LRPAAAQQHWQPPAPPEEYVFFEPGLVNTLSLTGLVASRPALRRLAGGEARASAALVTCAGPGRAEPARVQLEAWGSVAARLAALPAGTPVTINGHLAAGPIGGRAGGGVGGGSGRAQRLRVVVEAVWRVDPDTVPAGTAAAAEAALNGGGAARGPATGGAVAPLPRPAAGAAHGRCLPPRPRAPPDAALAAAFCAPGGSFVELAGRYGLPPGGALSKLLAAAAAGAPLDWAKLAHEAEQFASAGSDGPCAALPEVAEAVAAWVAANPGAANRDGSPKRARIRAALLADPRLGPRLAAAEAAAGAEGGGGGARSAVGTYVLIGLALGARAAGVALR